MVLLPGAAHAAAMVLLYIPGAAHAAAIVLLPGAAHAAAMVLLPGAAHVAAMVLLPGAAVHTCHARQTLNFVLRTRDIYRHGSATTDQLL